MLISLALGALGASPPSGDTPRCSFLDDPGYVLHERGTFTTLAGSDGVLRGGLLDWDRITVLAPGQGTRVRSVEDAEKRLLVLADEGRGRDHVRELAVLLEQSF